MKRRLLISFLLMIVMIVFMRWHGNRLISPQSTKGIIDLEFAQTPDRLRQLQLFWNYGTVLENIYFDFLFILAYTWFLMSACNAVNNIRSEVFYGLSLSAGAFDVLENFLMIMVWNGRFAPSVLAIIYYVAAIKFLLAGIVIGFLILSLFGLFRRKT